MLSVPRFQQRDSIKRLSPPWLQDGNGEKFLYTIGLALDVLLEKQNQAQRLHMPGVGDSSADPYLGNDRLLVQGPAETSAQFEARLQQANQAWQGAGSRPSVLSEVQAYGTNLQPGVGAALRECLIVGGNASYTTWSTIYNGTPQGAPPGQSRIAGSSGTGVWNLDGKTKPWRAWLILFMNAVATGRSGTAASVASVGGSGVSGVTDGFATLTGMAGLTSVNVGQWVTATNASNTGNDGFFPIVAVVSPTSCIVANPSAVVEASGAIHWALSAYPWIGPGPVWGAPGQLWGDTNRSWGLNCAPGIITSIRQILQRWKSQSTFYPDIIVSFGGGSGVAGSEFSPNSDEGSGNPDGTWGGIGKTVNGCVVPAKQPLNPYTAFCDGTGQSVQCYAKNVT